MLDTTAGFASCWNSYCRVGATTPWACQAWANTKAAYTFFGNTRVNEENIPAGHFRSTQERFFTAAGFPMLVLHDTTEFSYRHEDSTPIAILKKLPLSVGKPGPPLGLAAIKFWTRDKFHGANALKRKINPTRVPIEASVRFSPLDRRRWRRLWGQGLTCEVSIYL